MQDANLIERIQRIEDQAALKRLVDTFSNLADQKDVAQQAMLFTEDASVDSFVDGKLVSSLKGREQISQAFTGYLGLFDQVYHLNGQQTVEVKGDHAKGVCYCLVVLCRAENGQRVQAMSGVYYDDEYVRSGDNWLIAKRTSHFVWRDQSSVPASE